MARVTYSPLVSDVRGKAGDAVFASWKGRGYVRQRVIPSNPQTAAQTAVRDAMAEVVALWQQFNASIQEGYGNGADGLNISGYNDWCGRNRTSLQAQTGLFGPRRNNKATGDRIEAPTDFAYSAEPGAAQSTWTWTDPGQGADYHFGALNYNATDNLLIIADEDLGAMSLGTWDLDTSGIGDVFLVAFFVYRTTDEEFVHFGSGTHTQAS